MQQRLAGHRKILCEDRLLFSLLEYVLHVLDELRRRSKTAQSAALAEGLQLRATGTEPGAATAVKAPPPLYKVRLISKV